jgi:hypothetical protein
MLTPMKPSDRLHQSIVSLPPLHCRPPSSIIHWSSWGYRKHHMSPQFIYDPIFTAGDLPSVSSLLFPTGRRARPWTALFGESLPTLDPKSEPSRRRLPPRPTSCPPSCRRWLQSADAAAGAMGIFSLASSAYGPKGLGGRAVSSPAGPSASGMRPVALYHPSELFKSSSNFIILLEVEYIR